MAQSQVLTDANIKDPTKGIIDMTYYSAVNQSLDSFCIHSNHFLFILNACLDLVLPRSEIDEDDSWELGSNNSRGKVLYKAPHEGY